MSKKKILLIGNGAREHAMAKSVIKNENVELHASMAKKNPGIARLSASFEVAPLSSEDALKKYSNVDLAFIGPEAPLAEGVVDTLEKLGVTAFGPKKTVARLESSKVFTRELISKYNIPGNPRHVIVRNEEDMLEFLKDSLEVAVKPDGLTGGKGVKLYGEHLKNKNEILEYGRELLKKDGKFVMDEKLSGLEFTLQTFVDGKNVILMPLVRDFKRAYDGDKGPNTGSMGSFSCPNHLMYDIPRSIVEKAHSIMKRAVEAVHEETGERFVGILYGGFMYSGNEVYLLEFNVRFGDPEAINVLSLMEEDLVTVAEKALDGNLTKVNFKNKATTVVYLVPEGYPLDPISDQPVEIPSNINSDLYMASVYEKDEIIYTTRSRSIALLGVADSVAEARNIVYQDVDKIKGKLFYRTDIGKYAKC